nr:hypothetical protein Iba_chr14dCG12930 [Ipomoea batatas]
MLPTNFHKCKNMRLRTWQELRAKGFFPRTLPQQQLGREKVLNRCYTKAVQVPPQEGPWQHHPETMEPCHKAFAAQPLQLVIVYQVECLMPALV